MLIAGGALLPWFVAMGWVIHGSERGSYYRARRHRKTAYPDRSQRRQRQERSRQSQKAVGSRFLGGARRRAIADVRGEILETYGIEPNYVLQQGWEGTIWDHYAEAIDPAAKAAVMAQMEAYANE